MSASVSTFEDVIDACGGMGLYQVLLIAAMVLCQLTMGWSMLQVGQTWSMLKTYISCCMLQVGQTWRMLNTYISCCMSQFDESMEHNAGG